MQHTRTMRFANEDGTLVTVEIQAPEEGLLNTGSIRSALIEGANLHPVDADALQGDESACALMPFWATPIAGLLLPLAVVALLHLTGATAGPEPMSAQLERFLWTVFAPLMGSILTALFAGVEIRYRLYRSKTAGIRDGLIASGRIPG